MPESESVAPARATALRRLAVAWNRRDWLEVGGLVLVIAILHIVGFGALILFVAPHHYQVGTQVFGIGLGMTAYTFGLRHAFDADHIAAIDNTTRKLVAEGKKPLAVGFWFAMGHSSMVLVMACCSSLRCTRVVGAVRDDDSSQTSTPSEWWGPSYRAGSSG